MCIRDSPPSPEKCVRRTLVHEPPETANDNIPCSGVGRAAFPTEFLSCPAFGVAHKRFSRSGLVRSGNGL
eukprot:12102315-Alexandrium_andersonii.AAC.1